MTALEATFTSSIQSLAKYLDSKTTKTEVVNQLKEIGTPDALKVIPVLETIHATLQQHKNTDLSEVTGLLKKLVAKPDKDIVIPEQKETVKVSNLADIDFTTLIKAVKDIKTTVNVPQTKLTVEKPDLKPLQDDLLRIVTAIQKIVIPEVPVTDLSKLEAESAKTNKQLEEANKSLKKIVEKPMGGGGGGGTGTSFKTSGGSLTYVELTAAGAVPVDIQDTSPTTVVAFRTDVPTAGTRVQLGTNTVSGVVIQAPSTNTGLVYVGGATVSSTVCGAELQPGQSTGLAIDNTNKIYVDVSVSGDDVMVLGS
jgi:hypothetical protein